jgi:hypothetical protein
MTVDDHAGFLVPSWYVSEEVGELDSNICSFLLVSIFSFGLAAIWISTFRRRFEGECFVGRP